MKHRLLAFCLACALLFTLQAQAWGDAPSPDTQPVRLPIVMYHQISRTWSKSGDYVISVETFENDLKYLRDAGYESVSVRQLLSWFDGVGTLPEKPCMITFDDGYETTGALAAPLLEEYGFAGVVAVIGSVAQQYSDTPDHNLRYSHLSWETVAELSQGDTLEVQYHTWDMHTLAPRKGCNRRRGEDDASYRAALLEDAERFFASSEAHGVTLVPSVAYPFGAYCAQTGEIMEELGFRIAFTCTEQVNLLPQETEGLVELGRFNRAPGKSSADFFAQWD